MDLKTIAGVLYRELLFETKMDASGYSATGIVKVNFEPFSPSLSTHIFPP
jgi:hypothetical protein